MELLAQIEYRSQAVGNVIYWINIKYFKQNNHFSKRYKRKWKTTYNLIQLIVLLCFTSCKDDSLKGVFENTYWDILKTDSYDLTNKPLNSYYFEKGGQLKRFSYRRDSLNKECIRKERSNSWEHIEYRNIWEVSEDSIFNIRDFYYKIHFISPEKVYLKNVAVSTDFIIMQKSKCQ